MTDEPRVAPGTFCWLELGTSEGAAAKPFYAATLGWTYRDAPLPGGDVYSMIYAGERSVGGLYTLMPEIVAAGVPPHWMSYVAVAETDAAAARVAELGGTVMKEPFDVMDLGRMAVCKDPTGAPFSIWQGYQHKGADPAEGQRGTVCWHELVSEDLDRSAAFYGELFGWSVERAEIGESPYQLFKQGEQQVGGLMAKTPQMGPMPSCWVVYFVVPDAEAALATARAQGGQSLTPLMDLPEVGRMAWLMDPQGASFAVLQPPSAAQQ